MHTEEKQDTGQTAEDIGDPGICLTRDTKEEPLESSQKNEGSRQETGDKATEQVKQDDESAENNKSRDTTSSYQNAASNIKKIFENSKAENGSNQEDLYDILSKIVGIKNVVIANEIHGSSFFESGEATETEDKMLCLNLDDMAKLEAFFQYYKNKNNIIFYYIVSIACLGAIEKTQLDNVSRKLITYINSDTEEIVTGYNYTLSRLTQQLGLKELMLIKIRRNSEQKVEGIGYEEHKLKKLRNILWKEYVQLRKPMMDWLIDLYMHSHDETIILWSRKAILDYTEIDGNYICEYVERKISNWEHVSNLKFLCSLMLKLHQIDDVRMQTEGILNSWVKQHNRKLWLVSFSCFIDLGNAGVNETDLDEAIQECFTGSTDTDNNQQISKYLLSEMRRQNKAKELVYRNFRAVYDSAAGKLEKERCCLNLLLLLLWDTIYCAGASSTNTVVYSLHEAEWRKLLSPVFYDIWSNADSRAILSDITDHLFQHLNTCDADTVNILKPFFQMLAFNRSKICYENVIVYLNRPVGEKRDDAKTAISHFLELQLLQRKKERMH